MSAAASSSSSVYESRDAVKEKQPKQEVIKDCTYKTKAIQFLGRTTPIILQNDNGPCPLLAICNVLLLSNNLNLSPDIAEVSQEKLLSLVAERLIDSNSNVDNKDAGYVENQLRNIADAIDLLPRLATGINVNIKFRRTDDFEFTSECAIFDLLNIPLYHGWIVDPQDYQTASAVGSKSYNAIMEELVALEARNMEVLRKSNSGDCVDFAAATTATLGVPSPCLLKTKSFDESPRSLSGQKILRKGDLDEEAELLRVLKLSEAESQNSVSDPGSSHERSCSKNLVSVDTLEGEKGVENPNLQWTEPSLSDNCTSLSNDSGSKICSKTLKREESQKTDGINQHQSSYVKSGEINLSNDVAENKGNGAEELVQVEGALPVYLAKDTASNNGNNTEILQGVQKIEIQSDSTTDPHDIPDNVNGCLIIKVSSVALQNAGSDSSSGRMHHANVPQSEPIYEGEECIADSATTATTYENPEPMYEGEAILAKQVDQRAVDDCNVRSKDEITPQQGELIGNFLKNNASQLTFYGLFCLQDGLKERELCVFFRNNHFSTMFKYNGELYLLATDQGYLNQPNLVWEKLNEVNGDTLFMTSSFKEFKVNDNHVTGTWDEQNAMASTAVVNSDVEPEPLRGNPTVAQIRQHADERTKRHKAMSCIQNSVSDVIFTRIMACESPKQAWDKLQEEFQGTERTRQQQLLNLRRDFENLKMKEEETIKQYSDRIMAVVNSIRLLGEQLKEARIVEKVIATLPERYEVKISSLEDSRDLYTISLTELINALYAQEQRRASRLEEHQEGAFQARTNTAYKGKKAWRDKPRTDVARKEGQTCKHCRRAGHPKEKCWFNPDAVCQLCKKKGHVERVCKSKAKSRQSQFQQKKAEARVAKEDSDQEEQVFAVLCSAAQERFSSGWLLDSGCTNHMTPDAAIFKSLDRSCRTKVKIGNEHFIQAEGKGDVLICTPTGAKVISNVLLVPEIDRNLLSIAQLLEKGYSVVFKDNQCQINDPSGSKLMAVPMANKSFVVD
ncbi:hypothetical protein V6Z12_D11G021600 [Gossypium hirsutum]